jgi:hypothetical protein
MNEGKNVSSITANTRNNKERRLERECVNGFVEKEAQK